LAPLGNQIADRNDFDIRVILEAKGCTKAAYTIAHDPDANLSFGDRLPCLLRLLLLSTHCLRGETVSYKSPQ
jgi:hypothetical protein